MELDPESLAALDRLFRQSPVVPVPWPRSTRLKHRHPYNEQLVWAAIRNPDKYGLVELDPTNLWANQPAVTRAGVHYYLTPDYRLTGRTFADQQKPENRIPLIYIRDDGQHVILTGHHRAAAARLSGQSLLALQVSGSWGGPR